jgi:diguanylate cyclase (GGDEF)-like protein/PAS domain S-box-containing protein
MILLLTSIILWQESQSRVKAAEVFTQNTTTMLSHHIAGIFNEAETVLQAVDHQYRDQHARGTFDPDGFREFLKEALSWTAGFGNIGFIDAKGIYRYGVDLVKPVNLSDRAYFTRLKDRPDASGSGPMIFDGPIFTKLSQKWVLVMARRVEHPDGTFAGIVFLRWDVDLLDAVLESINAGKNATIVLRTTDMAQISRYPEVPGEGNGPGNRKVSNELIELAKEFPQGATYFATSPLDHTTRVYSFRKVEEYPFYIIVGQQYDKSILNLTESSKYGIALSAAMLLLTWVGLTVMFRQNRRHLHEQLNDFAGRVLTASPVPMLLLNRNNRITNANPAANRLFGFERDAIIGRSADELLSKQLDKNDPSKLVGLTEGRRDINEVLFRRQDGTNFTALQSVSEVPDATGRSDHFIETVVDITALKIAQERLRHEVNTDKLTGLLNRHAADFILNQPVRESLSTNTTFSVIMSDVDHFKRVNDAFGHAAGDAVLKNVAAVLKTAVRGGDYCIRWGGEEFLIVLPGCAADVASGLAERIRNDIAAQDHGQVGRVTMSFGVAQWDKSEPVESLIHRADQALYEAKHTGRNRVCFIG